MALTTLVYPLWSFLKKLWIVFHGIDRKAELKKKKRTRKGTENVKCLNLWDSLWIYIRSKIPVSQFCFQGFLPCQVMIYDRRSPEKQVINIYSFITPGVKFFKNFPFFHYYENLQSLSVPWLVKEDFRLNVNASRWEPLTYDLLRCM